MATPLDRLSAGLADRYRIDSELGAGGMATVFRAHDVRHERDVAIKLLHPDLGAALGADRFLAEIKTTARLQHPHILPLLDSGSIDGLLYYVMPMVTGETLRARLARERQLPVGEAVRIAKEVASALDYAHRQGVIHRDIKPENILLQDGAALVADFGIALAVQEAGGARLTQTGLSLGTPQYMSPEQAMGERSVDARADLYALGAVTYEMLTGEPPFTGPTIQAIIARLMAEEPRALTAQRKAIPPAVEFAVLRALEKLPADRFGTAAEFAAALDVAPSGAVTSATARPARVASRIPLVSLGVTAFALAGLAAWGWLRPIPSPEVVRYRITIDSVSTTHGWTGETAISPDGATIARSGGPGGLILLRRRDELAFRPLAGTERGVGPFFSPDGTQLGFSADDKVIAVPIAGGPPVVLADSLFTVEPVNWASDGYLYRQRHDAGHNGIGRSEARAGAPLTRVTVIDTAAGEEMHSFPELLPDGRSLLFEVEFRDGKRMIAVGDVQDGTHTVLFDGVRARYAANGHVVYTTSDGRLWAVPFDVKRRRVSGTARSIAEGIPSSIVGPADFAVSASGTLVYSVADEQTQRELTWVSRDGTRTPFDSTWKGKFANPVLSPDGRRVAVSMQEGRKSHIWVRSIGRAASSRLTVQFDENLEPAWTPDSRSVSYIATTGVTHTGQVFVQQAEGGSRATQMSSENRPISEQVWGRDGTLFLRTTTGAEGSGDILQLRPSGAKLASPLIASTSSEWSPSPSPDGRWLAYVSNVSGRYEVYVSPLADPASARWPVSREGGFGPRWSPRGDEIFFLDMQSRLVAAKVTSAPEFSVQDVRPLFDAAALAQVSISRRNFDVSADGQRFIMVERAGGNRQGEIVVVEHWFEELARGVSR